MESTKRSEKAPGEVPPSPETDERDLENPEYVKDVVSKSRPQVAQHLKVLSKRAKRSMFMKADKPKFSSTYLSYDTRLLFTWGILLHTKGTIFSDAAILKYVSGLITFAIIVCLIVAFALEDPHKLATREFYNIIHYIKVFIAFMLGLFMQNCLTRWWKTVSYLNDIFLEIKKIALFMNANAVPIEYRDTVERLCVMSCYLLEIEVSGFYSDPALNDKRWLDCQNYLVEEKLATDEEIKCFENISVADRSLGVWSWVGVFLAETPNLAPPLKTNLVGMGLSAVDSIKQLKQQVVMQLPLMYSHMLALLVHVNNGMLAFATGISVACLISDAYHARHGIPRQYHGVGGGEESQDVMDQSSFDETALFAARVVVSATGDTRAALYAAIQGIFVQLVSLLLQPVIYCAFLTIGGILADPFTNEKHGLPMMDYIQELRTALRQTTALANIDQEWLFSNAPGPKDKSFGKLTSDVIAQLRAERNERDSAQTSPRDQPQPLLAEREASEASPVSRQSQGRTPR